MNIRDSRGFTLIELMIVVVVIGILVAVVYPSFIDSLRQGRRSEGITEILAIQQREEKYRASNASYGTAAQLGGLTATTYYTYAISGTSATGYTITATGSGDQANDNAGGTACSPLSLVVNGANETKSPAACW